jgi:hypothetical protein
MPSAPRSGPCGGMSRGGMPVLGSRRSGASRPLRGRARRPEGEPRARRVAALAPTRPRDRAFGGGNNRRTQTLPRAARRARERMTAIPGRADRRSASCSGSRTYAYAMRPTHRGCSTASSSSSGPVTSSPCSGRAAPDKTTLASLLVRFRDPDEGRVSLDGHDLRSYAQDDIRRVVALAGQDAQLFQTTIRCLRRATRRSDRGVGRQRSRRAQRPCRLRSSRPPRLLGTAGWARVPPARTA